MKKIILFGIIFLWWTCNSPTIPGESEVPSIIETYLDYDVYQDTSKLFIQVEVYDAQGLDNLDSISSTLKYVGDEYVNFDTTFALYDDGENGDILPNNGIFSLSSNLHMIYGKYKIISFAMDYDGNSVTTSKYIYIEEKLPPEIISVEMPEIFVLDPSEETFLDISVLVKELNGFDDIKNFLYSINTDYMYYNVSTTEDCEFEISENPSEENFYHDISWILEYSETENDSMFVYSTSIPMRPVSECGGYGLALFKFTVYDKENNCYETGNEDYILEIIKCGDDICQVEYENVETCPEDCE